MSVIRDIVSKVDNTDQKAAEIRENLKILMSLAESKAKIFEDEIMLDLKTGKTSDDLTVPITKVVDKQIQYRATTADSTSKVFDELSSAINGMISDSSATGIVTGVAKIAESALDRIMGAGAGEEQVAKLYSVVTDYPAIVRFDFAFWSRKIQAESMKKYCETALACVAYKSAVDVTKLAFNDFLALYGPILNQGFGSDPAKMKEMIVKAKEVYSMYQTNAPAANGVSAYSLRSAPAVSPRRAPAARVSRDELALAQNAQKPRGIVISPAVKATAGNF